MRRRTILATVSAFALAGCTDRLPDAVAGGDTPDGEDFEVRGNAEPAQTAEGYYIFVFGEVENQADQDANLIELTVEIEDQTEQIIGRRSIDLEAIDAGDTQQFWFRIPVGAGTVSEDLHRVEYDVEVLE